ncbi:hypothetical protein LIER_19814 [Lithospermum erythrorhizon]|uniref:Anaphase-promoting complex subunit 4 n=1 Tax=Lithospermum erythrorhizon TaxID=34254 RepID=A0AAV3QLT3_LITER
MCLKSISVTQSRTLVDKLKKNELHQVAQQASSIEDLTEVIRTSISVMSKQWSEAMSNFHEKFDHLSTLISDHGFDSTPQEEFLSLLEGARTSPPLHQFLVNSLGEAGVRRMSKVVCGAGKELQLVVLNHLQPAAEIIGFRLGELKGLSKWRARFHGIGLDEKLVDNATEKAGMMLVHIERFLGVLSSVLQQFSNFFSWLLKSVKVLMSETSDQILPLNSELVVIFLRFLYNQDPVMKLLESTDSVIKVNEETMQRVKELVLFGGFSDTEYLKRTMGKEFQQMESCFKEAFTMPFATVSRKITAKSLVPLFPVGSYLKTKSMIIPTSVSYYKEDSDCTSRKRISQQGYTECITVRVPEDSFPSIPNCILIARRLLFDLNNAENDPSIEAALLRLPDGYHCVDLSLYKDQQIVLLLNETTTISESSGKACMVILQAYDLPFVPLSRTNNGSSWNLQNLESSLIDIQLENEKVRSIPHAVVFPLAVSASRGVACVFAARKRALVYILDEDEEEVLDSD